MKRMWAPFKNVGRVYTPHGIIAIKTIHVQQPSKLTGLTMFDLKLSQVPEIPFLHMPRTALVLS